MASSEQIKALLASHITGDDRRFYAIAMQVAAAEARRGHRKLADELRELIDKARVNSVAVTGDPTLIVRPRKEIADLLAVSYPKTRLSQMTLSARVLGRLERILEEQRNFSRLKSHGLNPRRKLLFTGPPGCGKTMSASAIAGELGIALFVVRLDGLITKFMGETISKLRLIFDAMQNTRAVYLFDEFDAIGTHRDYANEVGEIKRVLNSFLMYIEQDNSNSIIISATNHPQSLDYALFRRFDELLEFELPGRSLIAETFKNKLGSFGRVEIDFEELGKLAEGLSFADIVMACEEAVKDAVIHGRKKLTMKDIVPPLKERATFHERYRPK
ncbi:MAG TPA: ATPase [Blastocatellia bacterium]|nr:ATPase [Blastocatellia bacterium]